MFFVLSPSLHSSSQMVASAAIVHYANLHSGDLNLICLGPLTNLGHALKTDPHLGKKLNSCMIMGGNTMGIGNTGESTTSFLPSFLPSFLSSEC